MECVYTCITLLWLLLSTVNLESVSNDMIEHLQWVREIQYLELVNEQKHYS